MCPFEVVYALLPRAPIDLMPLPTSEKLNFDAKQHAELMLKLHEKTKENIERMNAKYKFAGDKGRRNLIFEPDDLVWLHLRKDRFPALRKSKLMPRADGPFKVPSGLFKTISEPMVCFEQTMHLSCTQTNNVSKRTEIRFHMTHVT
jgi:hypothetical protein